ncbi:phage baseplate assembly protein V [Trinickia dinghuensis]|uniref:phage baseplate assembly protein V n=1 Tax=Trinickia dinghuensis TaxID=2291023 RepID=UPI001FED103F|nr:phage baseplate assembly protein V [Trinickia dinghuensis]
MLLIAGRGRVSAPVNDEGGVQLLQAQINGLETIDNLKRVAEFGFTSVPPQGSDVAIVFVGGDRSSGLVIATNHQGSRPTGLQPGETTIFTADGKQIYLTAGGGIKVLANAQPVEVDNATIVTINASAEMVMNTPLLKVSGDIIDNYETNTDNMAGMRTKYNSHKHNVENVQGGESTIESDIPTVTE